jgi:drug/metabolite transporter (DMT)-like permease
LLANRDHRQGLLMLGIVVLAWGLAWPVHKVILETVSPFGLIALRSAIAALALFVLALVRRRLVAPSRADVPIVLSITLLHMVGFVLLMSWGLQRVTTGRSVVLAFTTPLWVTAGARLFLGEGLTTRRAVGVVVGLLGLMVLFNPLAFDWGDRAALVGNGAVLASAVLWAANVVHIRGHRWRATPLELIPWELGLATLIVTPVALASGSLLAIDWNARLIALLLYSGVIGGALAYWAAATAGRLLPAVTMSLGLLATPVVSIALATVWLGEAVTPSLVVAVVLILGGVALGTAESPRAAVHGTMTR